MKERSRRILDPITETAERPVDVKELHLARRNVDDVTGLDKFVNLEVLWINHNNISRLLLDKNFRLRALYAQNNKISMLRGCLKPLRFLESLSLAYNNLRDLSLVITELQHLQFLKNLDLRGNPVTQEEKYRMSIIAVLPRLEVLDCHTVTGFEVQEARALAHPRHLQATHRSTMRSRSPGATMLAFNRSFKPLSRTLSPSRDGLSNTAKDLERFVKAVQRKQRRQQEEEEEQMCTLRAATPAPSTLPLPNTLDFRKNWPTSASVELPFLRALPKSPQKRSMSALPSSRRSRSPDYRAERTRFTYTLHHQSMLKTKEGDAFPVTVDI